MDTEGPLFDNYLKCLMNLLKIYFVHVNNTANCTLTTTDTAIFTYTATTSDSGTNTAITYIATIATTVTNANKYLV